MVERKYIWTWAGFIIGFAIMLYRFIEEAGGYISNSPPWIVKVLNFWVALSLPVLLCIIGIILDIKITNRGIKERSIKEFKKQERISFNFKYARRAAIICFIYAIIVGPVLFESRGMFREMGYLILTLPASVISFPFLDLFWKLLEDPPDVVTVLATSTILAIEGYLVGLIIPNFKSMIDYIESFE